MVDPRQYLIVGTMAALTFVAFCMVVIWAPNAYAVTPTSFSITDGCAQNGDAFIKPVWVSGVGPADGYWSIYRSPQGGTWELVATVPGTARLFYDTDSDVVSGSYRYSIVDGDDPPTTGDVIFSPSSGALSTERTCTVRVAPQDAQSLAVTVQNTPDVNDISEPAPAPTPTYVVEMDGGWSDNDRDEMQGFRKSTVFAAGLGLFALAGIAITNVRGRA